MSITVDIDTSTINIAGRRWPAVALVCPLHEDQTETDYERTLGDVVPGQDGGWDVSIPLENGLLVSLRIGHFYPVPPHHRIDLYLDVLACYEYKYPDEPPIWLPLGAGLNGGDVTLGPFRSGWHDCEPEWINEFVDRIASKQVPPLPDTPRARMISLNESLLAHHALTESRKK